MGRHLSPRYGHVILASGYPVLQLSIDHNIDVQSVFSWAPKLARKCESKHWFSCGADERSLGRSFGVRLRDTKFSDMGLQLRARASRTRRASLWCKLIHPTIGWRRDKYKNHKHAHGWWILYSVSRARSKTMHLCSAIRHKSYLNYYMLHRFEIFCALELSRMAQLGSRLVASRLRKAASWQSVATHKCLKQSWSLSLV